MTEDSPLGPPPIPFEEIARFPLPGTAVATQLAYSPDERVLSFLASFEGTLDRRLYVVDLDPSRTNGAPIEVEVGSTGTIEAELSLEEQLRRERAREVGLGITSATWAKDADALLVPLPDGVYLVRGLALDPTAARSEQVLANDDGPIVAPALAPDASAIAFVRDGELFVASTGDGTLRRLTTSAEPGVSNGLAEFVAQEEMDRNEGFWWSPDSGRIAYVELDERAVTRYPIAHQASDRVGDDALETHRYPFAGEPNVTYRLGVVSAAGGETIWMDTSDDEYLVRVVWAGDDRLIAQLEARDQASLRVVAFDPRSGEATLLHTETAECYLTPHDDLRVLTNGSWTWSSERSGFRHLELRSASGELISTLTSGEWQVDQLEAVDEERGIVYFSGTKDGPTERHLYAVGLDGGESARLTREPGTHVCVVAPGRGCFADRFASLSKEPVVSLRSLEDGAPITVLFARDDPRVATLGLTPPELVRIDDDGDVALYGLYYAPEPAPPEPAPLVLSVYGGPEVQLVANDWTPTAALRAQSLRRRGFAVLVVDNRGSKRRGRAFEQATWRNLGTLEVADQVRAVRWAQRTGRADPTRVALYGWSYGGYLTLRCLELAPEVFSGGVAGAPVTDWVGYDTFYTERYMGTPKENPDGYRAASVLEHVDRLEGELLLVHGLIDENVHFRHSARLLNRLIRAKKRHELLCFPDERHLPRALEDRAYLEERIVAFLERVLRA